MRGVLPTGPNSLPGFDTLQPSLLSDGTKKAAMLSYNYTLDHQGFTSNISCINDTKSPILISPIKGNNLSATINGTCDGLADVLDASAWYVVPNMNPFMFWACKSIPTGEKQPTYYIYLRGDRPEDYYAWMFGNITCTVSPIQPAIFPVTYQSSAGTFAPKEQIATSVNTFPELTEIALRNLASIVMYAQNMLDNPVARLVNDLGVRSFGLPQNEPNKKYLQIFEAMIQGILVEQVCPANHSSLPFLMVVRRPSKFGSYIRH